MIFCTHDTYKIKVIMMEEEQHNSDIEAVGIREFRANLHKYTTAIAPVAVTSHGECIGFFIPMKKKSPKIDWDALQKATASLGAILEASGVSVDEVISEFNKARKQEQ